jgi:uncharacterized protein (DUF2344 family)
MKKSAEQLLEEMIHWTNDIVLEKTNWILKKKTISSISVEEIDFILKRIENGIQSMYNVKGKEYTEEVLKNIEDNGN